MQASQDNGQPTTPTKPITVKNDPIENLEVAEMPSDTREKEYEITAVPKQMGRNIQFEELPHPRKYERENSESVTS
jgi:hypothetical protein